MKITILIFLSFFTIIKIYTQDSKINSLGIETSTHKDSLKIKGLEYKKDTVPDKDKIKKEVIILSKLEYNKGELIEFSINATVTLTTNDIPFMIKNENGRIMNLIHSCDGLYGRGVDLFCINEQIVRKDIKKIKNISLSKRWSREGCSDAWSEWVEHISEGFFWDQKEYIKIPFECKGQTFFREELNQVQSGVYKIVVVDTEGNIHEKIVIIK